MRLIAIVLVVLCVAPVAAGAGVTFTVDASAAGVVARFVPEEALGATVDGQSAGDVARIYTPRNVREMTSAGFGAVSYRLRTELAGEAWHWNPVGSWSDPHHARGYWTSSARLGAPIRLSRGYRLPRRGNTVDQADDDGYSRIDDGDASTFWKSDPYLTQRFTREPDAAHPQHVVVDLGAAVPVDAIRISWAEPFATRFEVSFWTGDDAVDDQADGAWAPFPHGDITEGKGGADVLRLADAPVSARFVRILMTASSNRAPRGARDVRDGLGYAIREIAVGTLDARGALVDAVHHAPTRNGQTLVYVSSTDPWHRAEDVDRDLEQPGLDLFFTCGVTRGLPAMVPVATLYGSTPEDAANEIRYLAARRYPVARVEMGEEPDGQYALPEDYAARYCQWADAIRAVAPRAVLGGPALQSTQDTIYAWPDTSGDVLWVRRFLRYLKAHDRMGDLGFFSFEWYPFDDVCDPADEQLREAPKLLETVLGNWRAEGLPATVPLLATEYGYSSFAGQQEVDMPGALLNADFVGRFLSLGGAGAYCYGLEPASLSAEPDCGDYGGLMLLHEDASGRSVSPVATFYGARLATREWCEPHAGSHELHRCATVAPDDGGAPVSCYAILRPDGAWALLLVNPDPSHARDATLALGDGPATRALAERVDVFQLSPREYVWHADGPRGQADPNAGPSHRVASGSEPVVLPPYSITVVRGRPSSTAPPAR